MQQSGSLIETKVLEPMSLENALKIVLQKVEDLEKEDLDLKIRAFWFPPYDGAGIVVNGKVYTLVNREILKTLQDKDTTSIV